MKRVRWSWIVVASFVTSIAGVAKDADASRYRDFELMYQTSGVTAFKDIDLELEGPEDLQLFMQTFYVNRRRDQIAAAIRVLPQSPFGTQPGAAATAVAFFSEVFAANPDSMPEWQKEIDKLDGSAKSVLQNASRLRRTEGMPAIISHTPEMNDMWWASFFASGNTAYVDRLIDEFINFDERKDANLFFTGGSAMWSAASNAISHPAVKAELNKAKSTASDNRRRELIAKVLDLIDHDPSAFREEIRAIYAKLHEAGVW